MMQRLALAPVRVFAALAMLLAWLVTTNHCGLLLLGGGEAAVTECCNDAPAEPLPTPAGCQVVCCKAIKAPLAEKVVVPVAPDVAAVEVTDGAPPRVPALTSLNEGAEVARGPPRAPTLLELLTRGCLRSQAPPLVA